MRCSLTRTYHFEAAHFLPNVAEGHKCRRMHGHSYAVDVVIEGPIDPKTGWLMDFGDLDIHVLPLIEALDHRTLNEVEGLENPTSELLAAWLWTKLSSTVQGLSVVGVSETNDSRCEVRG